MKSENELALSKIKKTQWFIWLALVISMFVYGYLGEFMAHPDPEAMDANGKLGFSAALILMSLLNTGLAFWLSGVISRSAQKNLVELKDSSPGQYYQRTLLVPNVVGWALIESVAVYALIVAFTTGMQNIFYGMLGVSLVLMIIKKPH